MKHISILVLLFLFIHLSSGCEKESEPSWEFCYGCELTAWEGQYSGDGQFALGVDSAVSEAVEVQLIINNTYDSQLEIKLSSPGVYNENFYGNKEDTKYYFTLAGTSKSIQLNLYQKEVEYRITGVSQKYHLEYDPVTGEDVRVVDKTLSFEVFK